MELKKDNIMKTIKGIVIKTNHLYITIKTDSGTDEEVGVGWLYKDYKKGDLIEVEILTN